MLAVVLAAGQGSRLRTASGATPKPLVRVAGRSLLRWSLATVEALGASEILLFCRPEDAASLLAEVAASGVQGRCDVQMRSTVTRSGFETLRAGADAIKHRHFLLSSVDAVIPTHQLSRFIAAMACDAADVSFVVSCCRRGEDVAPTYVQVNDGVVTAIGKDIPPASLVTAGVYHCPADFSRCLDHPSARGVAHLSSLLGLYCREVRPGRPVYFDHAYDIDTPADIAWAETCLEASGDRESTTEE